MTYGLNVKNEFGEDVFDFNKSMIIQEQGMTIDGISIGIVEVFVGQFSTNTVSRIPTHRQFQRSRNIGHFMGSGHGVITDNGSNNVNPQSRFPTPLVPRTSLYFYQIGSLGLANHTENYITAPMVTTATPQHGMFACCLTGDLSTPLPYIRVDTALSGNYSDNYGMQIRSDADEVLFDSREPFLTISEVIFVSRFDLYDVITTGNPITLNLRTPAPNCYVSAPFHCTNAGNSGSGIWWPVIRQLNDSQLIIENLSFDLGTSTASTNDQFARNDLVLIVARNPFA